MLWPILTSPTHTSGLFPLPQVRLVNTTSPQTLSLCFVPKPDGNRCAGAVTVVQPGCWTQVQGGFLPNTSFAKILLSGVDATVGIQVAAFAVAPLDPQQERNRQAQLIDQVRAGEHINRDRLAGHSDLATVSTYWD